MSPDDPVGGQSRDATAANRHGACAGACRVALGILRFPGNLVASQLEAKSGESQFGLGEDRMIMRTLIDTVVWGVIVVCIAWAIYA